MDERLQFRRLLRGFSYRFLDNEFIPAEGDTHQTTVHTVALLGALSISLALLFFYKYFNFVRSAHWEAASWPDKQFLIAAAMSVMALAVVVTWDALFPDRRDCMILTALPVRPRTVFAAKICSVFLVFGIVMASLNWATTLLLPGILASAPGSPGFFRCLWAHIAAVLGAGLFVFAALLGLQGVLINVLSFRHYKWISTWVQVLTLFGILSMFFLTPDIATPTRLADPRNRMAAHLIPSFWFLGWYEELLGSRIPVVGELARQAREALAIAVGVALAAYSAGFSRYLRRVVEEADNVAGGGRMRGSALARLFDRVALRGPVERAVFHFGLRTMARNRKHRLLLAVYAGMGLAYVFHGVSSAIRDSHAGGMRLLDVGISSVPLVLSFFVLVGMRMLFTIPVELRANWIFRLTENGRPAEYLTGVRKLMMALGIVPLVAGTLPVYGLLWGWGYAFRHAILVVLILLVTVEYLVREFPKIPFTCSFLPGKANLKATVSIYAVIFLFFAALVTAAELALVKRPSAFWKGALAVDLVWIYRVWRRNQWERQMAGFIYEENPVLMVRLDLQG